MTYKLGKGVKVGDKILLTKIAWHTIKEIKKDRIVTDNGVEIWFGNTIYGWKSK